MTPESEAHVAEAVRAAQGPLRIRGGGTRDIGRPVVGDVLETGGLSGISLYEPGALTVVAGAGTPLAEIEAALDREGQRLAFEPMDHRGLLGAGGAPTIGGVVAGNVSGPRRIQGGACRDFLLGVRFVDGAGAVVKNGGRVMKNVTGYDLVKLMCGAWGTLGVLTEVSLKVLPKPASAACVLVHGLGEAEAVDVMARALGSPFDVSGAAHTPKGVDGHPVTMLRVEGFSGQVKYRGARLQEMFAAHDVRVESDPEQVAAGWAWLRDVVPLQGCSHVWRLSMKPSDVVGALEVLRAETAFDMLMDWGGGLCWIGMSDAQVAAAGGGAAVHARVQGLMADAARPTALRGHATLVKGPEALRAAVPVFQPEPAGNAALAAGLRARFDPRGILNTGLMS